MKIILEQQLILKMHKINGNQNKNGTNHSKMNKIDRLIIQLPITKLPILISMISILIMFLLQIKEDNSNQPSQYNLKNLANQLNLLMI